MLTKDFYKLSNGFYWYSNRWGDNPCLVCLYTKMEPRLRGIGFGVWDRAGDSGFVLLVDIEEGSSLIPLVDNTVWPNINFNVTK